MTRIHNEIVLHRPAGQVFNYVTTPGNWPQWHPASLGVTGAIDHPLEVGEACVEAFRLAGRKERAVWKVREREPGRRWVIDTAAANGGQATITYTLTTRPDGTLFERELVYRLPGWLGRLLDLVLIRARVARESAEALRRLKRVLEPF